MYMLGHIRNADQTLVYFDMTLEETGFNYRHG
jgi:hypothetical protein